MGTSGSALSLANPRPSRRVCCPSQAAVMPGGAEHAFQRVNNVLPDLRQLISPPRSPFFACGVVTIAADSECESDFATVKHDFAGTEALADTVAFLHGWLVGFTAGRCRAC